jgi:hypothetical protein
MSGLVAHAERVRAALDGPSRLLVVDGAGHNQSLNGAGVRDVIDEWIGLAAEKRRGL